MHLILQFNSANYSPTFPAQGLPWAIRHWPKFPSIVSIALPEVLKFLCCVFLPSPPVLGLTRSTKRRLGLGGSAYVELGADEEEAEDLRKSVSQQLRLVRATQTP